ncbi:MAG: hypothetical protein Q4G43_01805 [Mobilicoccus sp.]|nr:hypothetical protein [Mobilicoccus sp.]
MLTTVLTHEFRRTRFMLGVIAGIAAIIVLGATSLMLLFAPQIGALLAFATAVSLMPIVLIALVIDYWRSAYGRGGYLTHSYPVAGSVIYGARLLYGGLVVIGTALLSVVLLAPPALLLARAVAPPGVGAVDYTLTVLGDLLGALTPLTWVVLAAAIVGSGVFYLVQYYFAASIGSEGRLAALGPGGPLLVWFALYLLTQVLTFVAVLAVPLGITMSDGRLGLVGVDYLASMTSGADAAAMPFGVIPLLVVLTAVLVWRTAHSWNRKVTLR